MQTELYQYRFANHPATDPQSVPEQRHGVPNSQILQIWENSRERPNSQKEFELPEMRKRIASWLPPNSLSLTENDLYGTEYFHRVARLSGYAPSQLPHTWLLAMYQKPEKALDFIATTKTVSIINIFLLLNLKHSSYREGN